MFKLAELFVDITARDAVMRKQVGSLKGELSAMGVAIGTAAGALAAGVIASATSALTGFFARGIAGATNLAETLSKVGTVFGDSASVVTGQADAMARAFGLPKQAILDASASIGLVGKAAGQSQAEAAAMSATMAKLAADASSFYNVPLDQALEKIRSGLVGESEPLRAFGVLLSEDAVVNEALALGLAKSKKEIDEQAKVAARASLIQKGLADATGDLERTSGSTANQWRKLTGSLENMAVEIGTALAPAINALIGLATEMAGAIGGAIESSKGAFETFAAGVVEWANTIGVAWRNLPDLWEIVQIRFREMFTNMIAALATLPENAQIVGTWFANNWVNLLRDAFNAATSILTNFGDNIYRLGQAIAEWMANPTKGFHVDFKPLLDGFQATTEKLPELARPAWVSLQAEMDAVGDRIAARESKRASDLADRARAAAAPAKAAAQAAAKKTAEFKSESLSGSEFALKLRASIYEQGDQGVAKKQLEEQQKTRIAAEKTAELIGGGALVARLG